MSVSPVDTPIFSMLRSRMEMLGERQRLLAQNVANVSTPGYTPQDVDKAAFDEAMANNTPGGSSRRGVAMLSTNPGHLTGTRSAPMAGVKIEDTPDSETTLNGNSVVVEEQMMKIAETRMEFETAVQLYSKGLALIRLAAKSPK